jgi:ribosome maturation factor RimP
MINQGTFRRAFGALLTVFVVWSALPVTPAAAQDQEVRFRGRVSWVAGKTLVVSTDDSPSVRVDLSQVDQAEYQSLAPGDIVIVIGIIPFEGDRVVATSIKSLSP